MRHGIQVVEELTSLRYGDVVRSAGGKKRLRCEGQAAVTIRDEAGDHHRVVRIVERGTWRGGTRSYMQCPACRRDVLRLFWKASSSELRCRSCWRPTALRYASQERRRVEARAAKEFEQ
jgi:hypothetical protein